MELSKLVEQIRTDGINAQFQRYAYSSFLHKSKDLNSVRDIRDIIRPFLVEASYTRSEQYQFLTVLHQLHQNARIHGNQAGQPKDYRVRGISIPTNLQDNRNKNIESEFYLNQYGWIMSVSDKGSGAGYQNPHIPYWECDLKRMSIRSLVLSTYTDYIVSEKTKNKFRVTAYRSIDQKPC